MLGISRIAGDLPSKASSVDLIWPAMYWLISSTATSERVVKRIDARVRLSSQAGGVEEPYVVHHHSMTSQQGGSLGAELLN